MNLNLVLLGLPASGKSALLGALDQAARTKGAKVVGELVDLTGELTKLGAADDSYRPTKDAVVAYPLKRHHVGGDDDFVLHDTSGRETAVLLEDKRLDETSALPVALADADGVLLVIDASLGKTELAGQFRQFISFLETWQRRRSDRAKVGGLPVYLVLAKCDKLWQPGETADQWRKNLADRARHYGDLFEKALEASRARSFGRIDVHVWPTAARMPPGSGQAPYQIAELFADVFRRTADYRHRTFRSSQTLQGAMVGLGGMAAILLLMAAWYFATQPTLEEAALESRVQSVLAGGEDNVAERVREPLDDRLKELREIKEHPEYRRLPARMRDQVEATESSIVAYRTLADEYQNIRNPRLARGESDLDQIEKSLRAYEKDVDRWPGTRLEKRQREWLADVAAIRKAVHEERKWTEAQIEAGEQLRLEGHKLIGVKAKPADREPWMKAEIAYDLRDRRHKGTDRIEGTTIPYRVVYQFEQVADAETRWREMKRRLRQLREEQRE